MNTSKKNPLKAFFAFLFSSLKFPIIDGIDITDEEISYDLIYKKDPAIRAYFQQKLATE